MWGQHAAGHHRHVARLDTIRSAVVAAAAAPAQHHRGAPAAPDTRGATYVRQVTISLSA